jgi:hypothetical protein
MRTSLLSPASAVFVLCFLTFGCSGGSPFNAASGTGAHTPPVTPPVTSPITSPVTVGTGSGASVSVMISDPAACKAPNGLWSHVYVTISDVQASTNPDAAVGDKSFVDLTPGLSATPQQVDLLGKANSRCFLSSLSVSQLVAAGDYKQVRIFLAADSAASTVRNNACGASYSNCLVLSNNSLHDLQLGSAATNGIAIGARQIANASIGLNDGDQPSLDIDFDTCSSILQTANGGYMFNPTVHVGEIPSTGGSISGTVVSSATGQALKGGNVVVALEQKDPSTGVDRILMRTTASSTGAFTLCPVPQGTYDLVAVGVDGSNVSYSAGIETGIQNGQLAGQIPLVPGAGAGTLLGLVTTQNTGRPAAGVAVAIETSAVQQLPDGPMITVPLLPTVNPYDASVLTSTGESCPAGSDCASYSMQLPAVAPNVVACSENTAQFMQQGSTPDYAAESFAAIPGSGGIADCVSNSLSATATPLGRSIVLNPNESTTAATLAFTRCE